MRIGGLTPFTLSDFPGRTAAIIFTQGCNFRCPFCHNASLLPLSASSDDLVPEREVCRLLESRMGRLDGVVITGGEPTLQSDLPKFLDVIRRMGFEIKLDTNGSHPEMVHRLIARKLVDYIAMDIKAPWDSYDLLTGVETPVDRIRETMRIVTNSGIEHEFRTTVVDALLSEDDILSISASIPVDSPHRLQTFQPENALDPELRQAMEVA